MGFDDFVTRLKATFKVIGGKTGKFIDVSKLKIDIADLENRCKREFEKLGKIVYKGKIESILDEESVEECIQKIESLKEKIGILRLEINSINDDVICEDCKNKSDKKNCCSECGEEIPCDSIKNNQNVEVNYQDENNNTSEVD